MSREDDIRHTLVLILERSMALFLEFDRLHQLLTENFIADATETESRTELQLLVDKGFVETREKYKLSNIPTYKLSADGLVARRRREI